MKLTEVQAKALTAYTEALSDPLSHSDVRKALGDQLYDMHPQDYCSVQDVYGDDSSGDVVYQHNGQLLKAPYSLGTTNGKRTAEIDEDAKTNVVPHTTYEEEADDDDSMASVEAQRKAEKLYVSLPTYERFISKSERDAADSGSFAGKGKSFPILKPGDVMAAVRSMGRAGSDNVGTSTLKANIIRIAKKKGWTKYLPKAWQGTTNTESARDRQGDSALKLRETTGWADDTLQLLESTGGTQEMEAKIIAPGKGSSAFYPKEVLQRDGPKVFKKNTQVFINHATRTEEAERPEGDWHKLVGALSTDAEWKESHPKGAGLYAKVKFASEQAPLIREKAPYSGMSIRANGIAESGQKRDGLPVLKEFTSVDSVDIVTKAGAGGMLLTESAHNSNSGQEAEMTAEEVKKLVESATKPFREKALKADAREKAFELLEAVTLPKEAKTRIVERVISDLGLTEEFDEKAFAKTVAKEAKAEGEYLAAITGSGRVIGMGAAPELKPKQQKRLKEAAKEQRRGQVDVFEELLGDRRLAKMAVDRKFHAPETPEVNA